MCHKRGLSERTDPVIDSEGRIGGDVISLMKHFLNINAYLHTNMLYKYLHTNTYVILKEFYFGQWILEPPTGPYFWICL